MAIERVTETNDGVTTERVTEREAGPTTTVVKSGSGMGGMLIGLAVVALVAVIAYFLLSQNRNDEIRTEAVTGAASSVAESASSAASSVGEAAGKAAEAVNPD